MRIPTKLLTSTFTLLFTSLTLPLSSGCGMFEFFSWDDLPEEVMEAAMDLGYDEDTWANVRTNPVERIQFADLIELGTEDVVSTIFGDFTPLTDDVKGALMKLDFFSDYHDDEDEEDGDDDDYAGVCWDFWINHYDGYAWEDLEDVENPFGANVRELLEMIGWDQESWDDEDFETEIPESECMGWVMLDPVQKWAYTQLGWNPTTFSVAPCDPRCPDSLCPFNDEEEE